MGQKQSNESQTEEQRQQSAAVQLELQRSWEVVKRHAGEAECIRQFYVRMMDQGGETIRRLFAHSDMRRQEHMLMSVVNWAIGENYNDEGLRRIGVFHAHLGIKEEDLQLFKSVFMSTMREACGAEWTESFSNAWGVAFGRLATVFVPTMSQASQLITSLTNEQTKKELSEAHRALVKWFSERAAAHQTSSSEGESGIEKAGMRGPVSFQSLHSNGTFGELRQRYAELQGRFLYIMRASTSSSKHSDGGPFWRVLDLGQVTQLADEDAEAAARGRAEAVVPGLFTVLFTVGPSSTHRLCVAGETMKERWLVALRHAVQQFASSTPAPTLNDIDVTAFFAPNQRLEFRPSDFYSLSLLGKGSFGNVVKVEHKQTGRIYAMKIVYKENFHSVRNVIEIRRERAILEQIQHPFIVKFHGIFQSEKRLYLLFDFLCGGELFHHTKNAKDHHFSEEDCRFYLAEIASAVDHLHKNKIMHRDIKGDNFVLDAQGHVILTDFGFAKVVDPSQRNTATCGTLAYIAPEVLNRTPLGYSYEADWWSVGVVLFTMLTGFFPFLRTKTDATAKAIVREPLHFPSSPQLSPQARDMCCRLLTKLPHERLHTMEEIERHPWYSGFDFVALREKRLKPPFVPDPEGSNTKYFNKKYTCEKAPRLEEDERPQVATATATANGHANGSPNSSATTSSLPRDQDVFSSFFFENEMFASEKCPSDGDTSSNEELRSIENTNGITKENSGPLKKAHHAHSHRNGHNPDAVP